MPPNQNDDVVNYDEATRYRVDEYLSFPPRPKHLPAFECPENSLTVLEKRYLRRGPDGKTIEDPCGMFWRVSYHIASTFLEEFNLPSEYLARTEPKVDAKFNADADGTGVDVDADVDENVFVIVDESKNEEQQQQQQQEDEQVVTSPQHMAIAGQFYELLVSRKFFPNSPTFTGAGTALGQLAACFVLPIADDMGRDEAGIFQTLRNAALVQQTGGGNGFSFSRLRQKGAFVKSSGGTSSGPIGFLKVYDQAFGMVAQGGTRRGANMAVLRVDHPDIKAFITCKTDESAITNFNISVGITDEFMRAVEKDTLFKLVAPHNGKVIEEVKARELWDLIVKHAHKNGEPGVLFLDAANRQNPLPHLYVLEATNPCVSGDTWVMTDDGPRQVNEIIGKPTRLMIDGDLHDTTRDGFFQTGVKPVLKIRTKRGYQIDVTDNHLMRQVTKQTRYESACDWVPAGNLKPGEMLLFSNNSKPTWWGGAGTRGQGYLLGSLIGDGWFSSRGEAILGIWGDDDEIISVKSYIERVVNSELKTGPNFQGFNEAKENHWRLSCVGLTDLAKSFGVTPQSKGVTPEIEKASYDFYIGFIQGFMDCDGCVQGNHDKGVSLRLSQSDMPRLEGVQRMLQRLGIMSTIYSNRRPEQEKQFGDRTYSCLSQHELLISGQNLHLYSERIGFVNYLNISKLRGHLESLVRKPNRERYVDIIESIDQCDTIPVYDVQIPGINAFDANGFYVHNCGEQWLGPNENCCLGSVNLAQFFGPNGTVDWEGLKQAVFLSTIFLDNVVEKNAYVPEVPALRKAALKSRRIGLGFMGLADLMLHCGVRYGSDEGQEFAAQVTEWMRFWCMDQSIRLARERGAFPAIEGSIYDAEYLKTMDGDDGAHAIIPENVNPWTAPQPITPFRRNFDRPAVDWAELRANLKKHGIRNACQMTVAPTGTIATVAGCEGYGCEPVFAWAYTRHVNDRGVDVQLQYVSPMFMAAMDEAGLDEALKKRVIDRTIVDGTCQSLKALLPHKIRHAFVASMDITAEEHVRMQAAIQAFIDNSMSKTCNLPEGATKEDVAKAYRLAWELGCKGLTVYVTGSRQVVVLETKKEADKKADAKAAASASANKVEDDKGKHEYVPPQTDNLHDTIGPLSTNSSMDDEPQPVPRSSEGNLAVPMFPINMKDGKKVRPRYLRGGTFTVDTPVGKTFVAVNELDDDPFECFVNTAKAGSQTAAVSEALARLVSYVLRIESPVKPRSRLREVWDQLRGIGGDRSRGWGARRVSSLPDGMAHAFAAYLDLETKQVNVDVNLRVTQNPSLPEETEEQEVELHKDLAEGVIGDLCSECGQASLVNEEGCRKCYSCSYSEC